MSGEILHLYRSPGHNFVGRHGQDPRGLPMREEESLVCEAGRGIVGDRYFDYRQDFKGQITFFAWETHEALCAHLGLQRPPSVSRRNVILRDADLSAWIGADFELQGIRFHGTEEARPCYWMETAFGAGAEEWLRGRGGLRAQILTSGTLRRTARV